MGSWRRQLRQNTPSSGGRLAETQLAVVERPTSELATSLRKCRAREVASRLLGCICKTPERKRSLRASANHLSG